MIDFGKNTGFFSQVELELSCETASMKESTLYLTTSRRVTKTQEIDEVDQLEYKEEKRENPKEKCRNYH